MKAIITVGIPACGKSTWAEEYRIENPEFVEINRDNIRKEFFSLNRLYDYRFKRAKEKEVTTKQQDLIKLAAINGRSVIISDTNLNKGRRDNLIEELECLGYDVELKEFPIDFMTAVNRDLKRDESVGYQVIYTMYQQWLEQYGEPKYEIEGRTFDCYIFDIDGTLAEMHDRGPFEWSKVGNDKVIEHTARMLRALYEHGEYIFMMSGRDGCCRRETEEWLRENNLPYDRLVMREAGDMRKDSIIKRELFDEHIRGQFDVLGVFDDRPQVTRMWRDMGLPLFNVGDPYKEF